MRRKINSQIKKININKSKLKKIGMSLLALFLVFVIIASVAITALTIYVVEFLGPDDSIDLRSLKLSYSTVVYGTDSSGEEFEVGRIFNDENRVWVDLKDIPQHVQDAFVYTEDERFMKHEGVDWKRTIGSFANLIFDFWGTRQGGSTITQQLIKNATGENETRGFAGIKRKVEEIFRAISLEKKYYKDEILENYLNIIHLGNRTGGVQAASQYYFGKDVQELSIAEAASLATTTRSPANRNPKDNPEVNKEKREYTLGKMLEFGAISQEEYDAALEEELVIKDAPVGDEKPKTSVQSWYVDNVIEEVIADLADEYDYTREEAEAMLYQGGYKIYTPIDMKLQNLIEEKYKVDKNFGKSMEDGGPDSAMVVMNYSGEILALVGARGEKEGARLYNLATMAERPCGSTAKPIAVYSLALENDLINYSTIVTDKPTERPGGTEPVWPHNYTRKWYGNVTIEEALYRSLNTIPVDLIEQMGPQNSVDFMVNKLGFTSVKNGEIVNGKKQSDANLSLALGSFHTGTKLHELTAAYQIFGNGGYYTKPHAYTKVVNAAGDIILENNPRAVRALSEETATIMNRLLLQVMNGGENATGRAAKISGMEIVGKTGTTQDDKDRLFIGLTPDIVAGVWTGHRENTPIKNGSVNSPTVIFKNVLGDYISKLPTKTFTLSENVTPLQYCAESGELATASCPTQKLGYYAPTNTPGNCHIHSFVAVGPQTTPSSPEDEALSSDGVEEFSPDVNVPGSEGPSEPAPSPAPTDEPDVNPPIPNPEQ